MRRVAGYLCRFHHIFIHSWLVAIRMSHNYMRASWNVKICTGYSRFSVIPVAEGPEMYILSTQRLMFNSDAVSSESPQKSRLYMKKNKSHKESYSADNTVFASITPIFFVLVNWMRLCAGSYIIYMFQRSVKQKKIAKILLD